MNKIINVKELTFFRSVEVLENFNPDNQEVYVWLYYYIF